MTRKIKSMFILNSAIVGLIFSAPVFSKSTDNENLIIGAGAHFSWVVFNRLKPELEQMSGRKIQLFGKGSMRGVGCNAGIKNALKSTKDNPRFGFVCCTIDDKEIAEKKIKVFKLVKEPILTLVNKINNVNNLSKSQVESIFEGHITNWKEVGGADKPIIVVTRLHCKNRPGHWKTILPSHEKFTQVRIDVKSAEEMVKKISEFPGAIGHIGSAWEFNAHDAVKSVKVNGYQPTAKNLQLGQYPFHRTLSAVTNNDPTHELIKLIQYSQTSNTLKQLAREYELLPLN